MHGRKEGGAMVNSNERKLCLSGWLEKYHEDAYETPLKLQKFLFLYEAFSKTAGEQADFYHLKGYKRGPVFSTVWGDYTKDRAEFDEAAAEAYRKASDTINAERARKCAFVVDILTEKELSNFTHRMNIWKNKENRIMSGEYQVVLSEDDFTEADKTMMKVLESLYPDELINNAEVIKTDKNAFIIKKTDMARFTENHMDALTSISENEDLDNPVYVEIDDNGRLLIDELNADGYTKNELNIKELKSLNHLIS